MAIKTVINRLVEPKPPIKTLFDLKDGKYLCLLIVKNEWNRLFGLNLEEVEELSQKLTFGDIDWDFLEKQIPHKIYSVIEKFVKKYYGFDYIIAEDFKNGDQHHIYQTSVLVLSLLSRTKSLLLKSIIIQMETEFSLILSQRNSVESQMKRKFDPFFDIIFDLNSIVNQSINSSNQLEAKEQEKQRIRSFRVFELQQVFKIMENRNQTNLKNYSIKSFEKSENQLITTIEFIINYSKTFILSQHLKQRLESLK